MQKITNDKALALLVDLSDALKQFEDDYRCVKVELIDDQNKLIGTSYSVHAVLSAIANQQYMLELDPPDTWESYNVDITTTASFSCERY